MSKDTPLDSASYRLNNLYKIVDKNGQSIRFRLNPIQQQVLDNLHTRNIILKARQLGMSTFSVLYMLDQAIFNDNLSAGIVSYSLEHAQHIFKRIIGHALDTMTPYAKALVGVTQRSAREITFKNGSYLRVDTSLRGGSYQKILVSEFGKTCARNPLKAEEVMTGTLQAVPQGGHVIIESTSEGNDGYFADMVNNAVTVGNENLSDMDYKLFFFPWYSEPTYITAKPAEIDVTQKEYFDKIELDTGEKISLSQRYWYIRQEYVLKDKMKQEYPSTVGESFLSSSDAYYFSQGIESAYQEERCVSVAIYDAIFPVYVAMDIGVNDLTVMVFFQVVHGERRIIDYYADNNKGVDFYSRFLLQDKPYIYHTIFLPHDAEHRDGIIVENTYKREFQRYFSHTNTRIIVLKKTGKQTQISNAKIKLDTCVFSIKKTKPLIDMLVKYRKKWSEQYGKYMDEPYHDVSSNFADAFMYAMQGVSMIEAGVNAHGAMDKHRELVENRRFSI